MTTATRPISLEDRAATSSPADRIGAALCGNTYSIGRRLSKQLAMQTALCLSVVALLFYAATSMLFEDKHADALNTQATVVQEVVRKGAELGGEAKAIDMVTFYATRRPGTYLMLSWADGREMYRDPTPAFVLDHDTRKLDFQIDAPQLPGARLNATIWMDCSADMRTLAHMVVWLVVTVLAGGLFAGFATYWRVQRGLAPLREVAAQTRAIEPERLGQRLSLREPVEELQASIDQFNGLMDRLERAYVQLEGFNADVAHELRTPLTTLIGQAELALSRDRSTDELRDTLASGLEELQRMAAMINDMLFLASADRGATARRGKPMSVAKLVAQVVEFHEASLEDATLVVRIEGDAEIPIDEPLIKRAISNLVGNATRYAQHGTTVAVRIEATAPQQVRLQVENVGPTIAPDHLPRLFDRFFRADTSRQCPQAGKIHHGLGLAIVAAIARMHGGQPWVESAAGMTRIGFTISTGGVLVR
jgi:two-component system, OmpR family, heavy metal sensor histidine kinase CusS